MTNKGFAFGGAGVLVVGLFTPIVTLPFLGTINLFNNGTNVVALALLTLAAIAAGLALKDRERDVIWPGIAAGIILAYYFLKLQYSLSQMRGDMAKSLEGNPFAGIAQTAMSSVQLQWGWIVLGLGAGLLIYAGATARRVAQSGLMSIDDGIAKTILGSSILVLIIALAWDWIGKGGALAENDPAISQPVEPLDRSPGATRSEDNKSSADEVAYIRNDLRLYDLTAKYYESLLDGTIPGVDFKIKNIGGRTLNRVQVRVVFHDSNSKPIAEEEYNPVLVVEGYSMDDNKPCVQITSGKTSRINSIVRNQSRRNGMKEKWLLQSLT